MAAKSKPILSIGIIMKDEIRCIERCLSALQPLRDALSCELVIADTGSTDGSREIAEKYADILFDFPWIDDFAAARNAVMDRCSGAWYLSVDCDEYLDPNVKEIVSYFKGKEVLSKNTGFVNIRNYNRLDMEKSDYVDFNAHRIVKLSTGIRYDGIIHERFNFTDIVPKAFFLLNTTFHHDGYARTTPEERANMNAKSNRNMDLLRRKLEQSPDDMTYLQCIESSNNTPDRLEFAKKALDSAKERNFKSEGSDNNNILKVMICRAVSVMLVSHYEEAESELLAVDDMLSDLLMHNLDTSFAAIIYYQKKKQWEKVLYYVDKYQKSYDDYQNGGKNNYEFIISPTFYGYIKNLAQSFVFKVEALIKLEREEEALCQFEKIDFSHICEAKEDVGMSLRLLIDLCRHERAASVFDRLYSAVMSLDEGSETTKSIIDGFFTNAIRTSSESENYRLMVGVPGFYGICAKILASDDPAETDALCLQIDNFSETPTPVLLKIIKTTNALPQKFYECSSAYHLASAYSLAAIEGFAPLLISFIKKNRFHGDVVKINFAYHWLASAIQRGEHEDSEWDTLCKLFLMFSEAIIYKIYNEELIQNSDYWNLCITNHHLSLIIIKVSQLVLAGDELGVINALRKAIDVSVTAKGMVSYLIENAARIFSAPPAELVLLADKLRTILAMYKDSDSIALEVKNSDAYKQIAHLVELPTKEELGL